MLGAGRFKWVDGRGVAGGRQSALGFAGRCALRLGVVTALTLPLLAWLTDVSVDASLSVLGFDAFGAGIELHGHLGMALVLGAVWGAGAGGCRGLLAYATGAAGRRASRLARGDLGTGTESGTGAEEGIGTGVGVGSGSDGWGPGYPERSQPVGAPGMEGVQGMQGVGGRRGVGDCWGLGALCAERAIPCAQPRDQSVSPSA